MVTKSTSTGLLRRQLDELFDRLRRELPKRPENGWLQEIRRALTMTAVQHARRMGVAPSTLSRLEQSEVKKTITLVSLERAADALECDVHYVLVPRESLTRTLLRRGEQVLRKEADAVAHTMALEGQAVPLLEDTDLRQSLKVALLIESGDKRLWEEP